MCLGGQNQVLKSVKRIYAADSLIEGQMILDQLIQAGIPADLFHQNAQGALGDLPVTLPEVWIVRDLDFDKANSIIKQFVERPEPLVDQHCTQCGEVNPDSFEVCWLCLNPLLMNSD